MSYGYCPVTNPKSAENKLDHSMLRSTVNEIPPIHEKSYLLCQSKFTMCRMILSS